MKYRALRTTPITARTGEVTYEDGRPTKWHAVTAWTVLGIVEARSDAEAMRIARATFGGRPVLEPVEEQIHYIG